MMNMMNPNKNFVSVLTSAAGQAEKEPEINPDQGMIDAAQELIKAVEKKDAARIVRVFKVMMKACYEEMEVDGDDSEMS